VSAEHLVADREEWLRALLDLAPMGRDEENLEYPAVWLHRHDAYPDGPT
jgi:predicted dithiol-disulfide oxidoreductase (DUF899 family)